MTTPADALAVQRAHAESGRDAALAEVRRRWPMIIETMIERTLDKILAAPVEAPSSPQTKPRGLNGRTAPRDASGKFRCTGRL
ncbi:MAG: hypothetical protein WCJ64_11545 [Rhodospirillaceae bacterium]